MPRSIAYLLTFLFLASSLAAQAATLSVSPLRVELSREQAIGQVAINNGGDEPVVMEARILAWDQDAKGEWQLSPTTGVQLYPAQVSIPAHSKGYVRLGASSMASGAYRLELQELADPAKAKPGVVRILTRISLPVFILPEPEKRTVAATLTAQYRAGQLSLVIENQGSMPLVPQDVLLQSGGTTTSGAMPGYALPGRRLEWTLPWAGCSANTLALSLKETELKVVAPLQGCP